MLQLTAVFLTPLGVAFIFLSIVKQWDSEAVILFINHCDKFDCVQRQNEGTDSEIGHLSSEITKMKGLLHPQHKIQVNALGPFTVKSY